MDILQSATAARVTFTLSVTNIVTGVMVALTCRCIPGWKLTSGLKERPGYQRFYKLHCYIWWAFWGSVIAHAVFAIGYYGTPG